MSWPVHAPPRRARGPRHRICRPWVPSSTLLPKSLPSASMRCTCRRCGVTGLRQALLRPQLPQAGPGSNQVRGGSHPAPRIPLRCVPLVCHPALTSGLPEARLESRSWPAPVSRHRNFRRSAPGGTSPGLSPGGDTPVIVLTRACGRVAPVTRGSDVLACGFPGGARTRRSELLPPRSRDGSPGIRSAGRQPPRTEFHAFSLSRRRVGPAGPQIFGNPSVPVRNGRYRGVFLLLLSDRTRESRYRRAAFMAFFYDTYALVGTSGSRKPASGPQRYLATGTTTLRRGLLSHCRSPACVTYRPGAAGLWPPRHPHPHPPPCGSGVRTELESRPDCRDRLQTAHPCSSGRTQACHAHLATAENRSSETGRTEQMAVWTLRPVSEGHLTGVGRPV